MVLQKIFNLFPKTKENRDYSLKGEKTMSMFCYQCEQTAKGQGCTIKGVCGKDEKTAALQDLIIDGLKELSFYAYRLKKMGINTSEADKMVLEGLFTTVTNVNFDTERERNIILELTELRKALKEKYPRHSPALRGHGYRELLDHLYGEKTLEIAVEEIKRDTRNYAKRQLTWLRNSSLSKEIQWI